MATIPVLDLKTADTVTALDLASGPHTFTHANGNRYLAVTTDEAAGIVLNIVGDGVTTANCPNLGEVTVADLPDFNIAENETKHIYLNAVSGRFGAIGNNVTVTITGITTGSSTAYIINQ